MVATQTEEVASRIVLAAGMPGDAILADQPCRLLLRQGASHRIRPPQQESQQRLIEVLKKDADSAEIAPALFVWLRTSGRRTTPDPVPSYRFWGVRMVGRGT